MKSSYVVAIVPPRAVDALERKLRTVGIGGITLTGVKGFGEYKNFFFSDRLSDHTKIEIFAQESQVEELFSVLMEIAASDVPGARIAAVMSVEKFLHLRTGAEVLPGPSV